MTNLRITKAVVITGSGPDRISLELDCPTTFPNMGYEPYASLEAQKGFGVQWVKENIGLEPEVINRT